MNPSTRKISRRRFLEGSAAGISAFSIVPRHVLGMGQTPPSEELGGALIGCGGQGPGTVGGMGSGIRMIAFCDVDRRRVENAAKRFGAKDVYTDFRKLLERPDIDVVAIATHPGWHPLTSIAAMEAGKDVLCEKPMSRFIAEGRAVVEAAKRYGRIFQIGTYGRFNASRDPKQILIHKIMASGLLKECQAVHIKRGGLKVAEWSGMVRYEVSDPGDREWDLYCGPAPLRPFHAHRFGGTHRGYWDYEGGGLADMAQHHFDPINWVYAKDATSPVQVEASAPPAHPEACGMWGWVELRYADGLTFVMDSDEWGDRYDRQTERDVRLEDLSPIDQQKIREMPDPEPLVGFAEAVKTRQQPGGHAEAAHRTATLMHLANIAIRTGRKITYDPKKEQILGDAEANRLVNQPMRAPWRVV
ncbi:MAG: Gfo/Idh/MocA family oxidoreductase [Pirellulales bacterium]|nr:Gfo/Idh/MocA family oxidoreductase [Pirellulales bacterium]